MWLRPCEFKSRHPHDFFDQTLPRRDIFVSSQAEAAIVLVSNGPGELSTWVRPLALRLHEQWALRPCYPHAICALHLVLVPCPNGTGQEASVARRWQLFDRVLPAVRFWWLLLRPGRHGPWPRQGVVVFLGGDQFWTVLLAARLGYRHLTYAEWVARWPRWNDRLALMGSAASSRLAPRWRSRAQVVGDLMADLDKGQTEDSALAEGEWIALLPGSKRAKLQVGMPFLLQTADCLASLRPGCRFLLPVAPTTSVAELMAFAGPSNSITTHFGGGQPTLERSEDPSGRDVLRTAGGQAIVLVQEHPSHAILSQCSLALTTVGANTAELGALGLPMMVLLPTQHLEVMQAWDGWMGLLARLPFLRRLVGVALTAWRLRHRGFLAWPNISAGRSVVPEHVGCITPAGIAAEAAQWLRHPEKLALMRDDLRSLRGKPGAVKSLAEMVVDLVPPGTIQPRAARYRPMHVPWAGSPKKMDWL